MKPMVSQNVLVIDLDNVLYPESELTIDEMKDMLKKTSFDFGFSEEYYDTISKKSITDGEIGFFNFAFNLCNKKMEKYNEFTKKIADNIDYSKISPNPELYKLLQEKSKKNKIIIFTNNSIYHCDKVFRKLWNLGNNEVFFTLWTIESTLHNNHFNPKQTPDGFPLFLKMNGLEPWQCTLFDDSITNIKMARHSGMKGVLISERCTIEKALQCC